MAEFACPVCGADTRVVRTNKSPGAIRRDRQCGNRTEGPHTFETIEQPVSEGLLVERGQQREGRSVIEPFDRKKIERSMRLAAAGILSDHAIATATDAVIAAVKPARAYEPIPTRRIGDEVLEQLLDKSKTAGLRYATVYLSSRHIISTPADLEEWISNRLPSMKPFVESSGRPQWVTKRPRTNRGIGWGEEFRLDKLWRGIQNATSGLAPDGEWDAEQFTGALVAWVLNDLHGQPIVTSGQLSGSSLQVLRRCVPLAYVRYSIVAKRYDRTAFFLDECEGLERFPSPPIDLEKYRDLGLNLLKEMHNPSSEARGKE